MTTAAYCSHCGSALREHDRFCPRCGEVANATAMAHTRLREFRAPDGPLQRLGDFAVNHAKGLLALVAFGALVGLGLILGQEKSAPESSSSPGYQMVRQLKASGDIDSFKAIEPEDGWDTEYSLNDGDGHIRFRGDEMEYAVSGYEDDLKNAIESEAHREGFTG
jgi:hypothetical protein